MKKIILLVIFVFGIFLIPNINASGSYIYSYWRKPIHSAEGLSYFNTYYDYNVGSDIEFVKLVDIKTNGDYIYLLDEKAVVDSTVPQAPGTVQSDTASRIFVLDKNFQLVRIIDSFELVEAGLKVKKQFKEAQGLYVTDKHIYVADTGNNQIVKLDHNGNFVALFRDPNESSFVSSGNSSGVAFLPIKLTVDSTERLYVVCRQIYEGIVEFDSNGEFARYVGVNKIHVSPVEAFWRKIRSEEQLAKGRLFVPREFTNLTIDNKNFLWTTSRTEDIKTDTPIKRINPSGIDVLQKNGYTPPVGDVVYLASAGALQLIAGPSEFYSITLDNATGNYTALDTLRGRLFTYDKEGNLLYVSGGLGTQADSFGVPVSVTYFHDSVLVVDQRSKSIIVFEVSEFGKLVNQATVLHQSGKTSEAAKVWEEVVKKNTNYELAYVGIGKAKYAERNYAEAMEYFYVGRDRRNYSKALKEQRMITIEKYFNLAMGTVIVAAIGITTLLIYKNVKKKGNSADEGSDE